MYIAQEHEVCSRNVEMGDSSTMKKSLKVQDRAPTKQ